MAGARGRKLRSGIGVGGGLHRGNCHVDAFGLSGTEPRASLPRVRAFLRVLELSGPAGFSRCVFAPAWPTLACARRSSPASLSGVVSGLATSRMRE